MSGVIGTLDNSFHVNKVLKRSQRVEFEKILNQNVQFGKALYQIEPYQIVPYFQHQSNRFIVKTHHMKFILIKYNKKSSITR